MRQALRRLACVVLGAAAACAGGLPHAAGTARAATTGPVPFASGAAHAYEYDQGGCDSYVSLAGRWTQFADAVTFSATATVTPDTYCGDTLGGVTMTIGSRSTTINLPYCIYSSCSDPIRGAVAGLPDDTALPVSLTAVVACFAYDCRGGTVPVGPGVTTEAAGSLSLGAAGAYNQEIVTLHSNLYEAATWTLTQRELNSSGGAMATNTFGVTVPGNGSAAWTSGNQGPGHAWGYAAAVTLNGQAYTMPALVQPIAGPPAAARVSSTAVTLSWPAVYDASPYGLHEQACTSPSGSGCGTWGGWSTVASTAATSYTVSGLTPNTLYSFAVGASNPDGGGGWWQAFGVWTLADNPGSAAIADVTQTTITETWTRNGDPSWTTYQVVLQDPGTGAWLQSPTTSPGATRHTFTGLSCGTAYDVWVRAENNAGTWNSAFVQAGSPTTVPCAPGSLTGSDGGLGWSNAAGRGWVTLSWPSVPGATGYRVWIFDGNRYDAIDVGGATSWDSRQWLGYPSAAAIASWGNNSVCTDPYLSGAQGFNLRDDPNGLYRKTCGTTHDSDHTYRFGVSSYNASGDSGMDSSVAYQPVLPVQTDASVPQVASVALNGGQEYAYSESVAVTVDASDSPSGICAVATSPDDVSWSTTQVGGCRVGQVAAGPTSYTYRGTVAMSAGPGTKTEYVRVENVAGTWSAVATATVYVQAPPPPTVGLEIDGGLGQTAGTSVTLDIQATDQNYGQSQLRMRFSNGGGSWSAWTTYAATAPWTVAGHPGADTVYVEVRDPSGAVGQAFASIGYGSAVPSVPTAGGSACAYDGVSASCTRTPLVTASFAVPAGSVSMETSFDGATWSQPQDAGASVPLALPTGDGLKAVFARYFDSRDVATAVGPDYFVLDTTAPVIRSVAWLNGAAVTDGGAATLVLQASDNITPAAALRVAVTGAASWSGALPPDGRIPLALTGGGYVTVTVTVTDQAGNAARTQLGIYNS